MRPRAATTALVLTILLSGSLGTAEAADLSGAKALYAAASYEDALTMLSSLEATEPPEQIRQLRALCFLALGRTRDAEQAVEEIVAHNPTYAIENAEVSPKLVTLFHDVRRRALPAAARSLYAKAKSNYDDKRWADAKTEFTRLLGIIADPDVADQQPALADLKQLGEGFLRLSESELATEARRAGAAAEAKRAADAATAAAAAPPPVAAPAAGPSGAGANRPVTASATRPPAARPAPPPTPSARPAGAAAVQPPSDPAAIYTAADRDVTPPIEQRRLMPRWTPPNRAMAVTAHSGLLEIVIGESGTVESATMAKPVVPQYDQALLDAARNWRFTPARRNGVPVRYRQVIEIVLRPTQQD